MSVRYIAFIVAVGVSYGNAIKAHDAAKAAVTYECNSGRFGNNLFTYMHAKWVSYHFDIPLLYQPFHYSDQLVLHDKEKRYKHSEVHKAFSTTKVLRRGEILDIDRNSPTLYVIPYFPECLLEVEYWNSAALYFNVPWDNVFFKKELKASIYPKNNLTIWDKPDNGISVAVHVRKTSNGTDGVLSHDYPQGLYTPGYSFIDVSMPLTMPSDAYYIDQIKNLAHIFHDQQLYVYILSDDKNVAAIMTKYGQMVNCSNVRFFCRASGNSHDSNVLEDFFFITRCDCLIRSESTYATSASKLGDYLVQISPVHHQWDDGHLIIDETKISLRKNLIHTDFCWIWPHRGSWCRCRANDS